MPCYTVYPHPDMSVNMQAHTTGSNNCNPHITWRVCVCVRETVLVHVYLFIQNWLLQSLKEELYSFILGLFSDTFSQEVWRSFEIHSRHNKHLLLYICLAESGNVGSNVVFKLHYNGSMANGVYLEYRSSSPQMSSSPSSACLEASGADCSHRKLCLKGAKIMQIIPFP